jgi:hypothetical protein
MARMVTTRRKVISTAAAWLWLATASAVTWLQ